MSDVQTAKQELLEALGNRDPWAAVQTWRYALNMMNSTSYLTPLAYNICAALESVSDKINVKLPEDWTKDGPRYELYRRGPRKPLERAHWDAVKATIEENINLLSSDNPGAPALVQNMDVMAQALELDQNARDTIALLCMRSVDAGFSEFLNSVIQDDQGQLVEAMPTLFGRSEARSDLRRIFDTSSPLMKYGMVQNQGSRNGRACIPVFDEALVAKMSTPGLTSDEVIGRILGSAVTTTLNITDFQHLGRKLDFILRRLQAAIKNHEKGVNILIYGEPGTGKTELAAVLVAALQLKLYAIGENQENPHAIYFEGAVGIGQIRLGELRRAQGLLRKSTESILMFDEFEDLLIKGSDSDKTADVANKVQLNRTLESNDVPTIWLGNKPWKLDPAFKQRFTYSLFMDTPPTLVRDRIWQRRADMSGVKLDAGVTLALARRYAAPPRMVAQAVNTFAATGLRSDLEGSLQASIVVGSGSETVKLPSPVPTNFSAALLTAEVACGRTLAELIELGQKEEPFWLLMQGAQGSGASTAVRYLAEQINLNPLEMSMEDLRRSTMGPPPEVRLAQAFEFAASSNRFLVVNDIEHLLLDPSDAKGGLHKSLAHVFIKAAQAHPLPFAATSETGALPDDLTLLFSDHLTCGALSCTQARAAYRHFFGSKAPRQLPRENVYLGDFAEAARFAALLGKTAFDDAATANRIAKRVSLRHVFRNI